MDRITGRSKAKAEAPAVEGAKPGAPPLDMETIASDMMQAVLAGDVSAIGASAVLLLAARYLELSSLYRDVVAAVPVWELRRNWAQQARDTAETALVAAQDKLTDAYRVVREVRRGYRPSELVDAAEIPKELEPAFRSARDRSDQASLHYGQASRLPEKVHEVVRLTIAGQDEEAAAILRDIGQARQKGNGFWITVLNTERAAGREVVLPAVDAR